MLKCWFILMLALLSKLSAAQPAARYDVIITEIMADPTPVVALPDTEYVELYNRSGRTIQLQGFRLSTGTASSGALPAYALPADSFVVLASSTGAAALAPVAKVVAIPAFPALPNDGAVLTLTGREGQVLHAVPYTTDWHDNTVKKEGGWSLEMIDSDNPCTASGNWKSSTALIGGTPGKTNAANARNRDETPPAVVNAYLTDNTTIVVNFNESLDSLSSVQLTNYTLTPTLPVVSVAALNPLLTSVQLKMASPLQPQTVYTLTVQRTSDCSGNAVGSRSAVRVGVPQPAAAHDVVINEILFNPKPTGYDYVELYNRSQKIIDAHQLYLANRNSGGSTASAKRISETPFYLFPGDHIVITENSNSLQLHYYVQKEEAVLTLATLPSYPDKEGTVVVTNAQGSLVDEVRYTSDWHFALLRDAEGIALERIDPNGPSQDGHNWHSAAATAGYGTPTYKNSQYKQNNIGNAAIAVVPKVFSPDGDGHDDVATVQYNMTENGYVANVYLFDAGGRQVRHLVKNAVLGLQGQWKWDGLDEKAQRLPIGTYIIYTEIFNLQGKKQQFKNPVVLARKF